MQQRGELIQDVVMTVVDVGQMVESHFKETSKKNQSELGKVRRALNESMEAARRAEARTAELDRNVRKEISE